jgi:hypothetical protein
MSPWRWALAILVLFAIAHLLAGCASSACLKTGWTCNAYQVACDRDHDLRACEIAREIKLHSFEIAAGSMNDTPGTMQSNIQQNINFENQLRQTSDLDQLSISAQQQQWNQIPPVPMRTFGSAQ